MPFISGPDGDLKTAFVSDSWLLDQFVGNTLYNWGYNVLGGLGDNTTNSQSVPIQTVAQGNNWKQVSCGQYFTAAVKTDGTLWCWGYNAYSNIGDNTAINRSSPVQTVTFGTNWKQVSCGYRFTSAIKTDGTLWTWGYNALYGALGDNTTTNRSSPVQTVAFGANWKQVASGASFTTAIKTDGTLWCWGKNDFGQIGDNTTTHRSSPVQTVAFGTNWKQAASGASFAAAIKTDGSLWCWGKNDLGQIGDNTTTHRSSPVQTVAFGTNWKQVACGYASTAIKTDGTLWLWGRNNVGQLGDNTTTNRSSPVQTIAFGTNWKQVSCDSLTMAVKNDGSLWTWGENSFGELGDNTTTHRSSPVQTIINGYNWKQVSCGRFIAAAVTNGDL